MTFMNRLPLNSLKTTSKRYKMYSLRVYVELVCNFKSISLTGNGKPAQRINPKYSTSFEK